MNELDLIFLLGALVAGLGGWRFGFVRRVIGWIGLVIGVVVASKLLPVVFETPETPEPGDLIRSLVVILGAGLIGPGERYTVLVQATDLGTWVWHCHILNHVEMKDRLFGMATAVVVQDPTAA